MASATETEVVREVGRRVEVAFSVFHAGALRLWSLAEEEWEVGLEHVSKPEHKVFITARAHRVFESSSARVLYSRAKGAMRISTNLDINKCRTTVRVKHHKGVYRVNSFGSLFSMDPLSCLCHVLCDSAHVFE